MTTFHECDIAIVGAGAAGLATAIFTRQLNPAYRIALLDGARRPGAKILVSGGSRCNVTNATVSERDFWGATPGFIRRVLRNLPVPETVEFFARLGVTLHEEEYGKLFPDSNRSRDVLDALLREVERTHIDLLAGQRVTAIERSSAGFTLTTGAGAVSASRVVIATGGCALPKSGSDGFGYRLAAALGHSIVPPTPALAPLLLAPDEPMHAALSGVAVDAEITVWVDAAVASRLRGPLLWTHFGLSGPVALNASRHWARARLEQRDVTLTVSLVPDAGFTQIDTRILSAIERRPRASIVSILNEFVPASMAAVLPAGAAVSRDAIGAQLSRDQRRALVHQLVAWSAPVTDTRGYTYAEATSGGVATSEINPATMASRSCPGLFLVGEVLDVDGRLGGFNFQWAWSSARAAANGLSAAGV